MRLHPHLHLLLPSSPPSVLLECRLYLPGPPPPGPPTQSLPLFTSSDSHPSSSESLSDDTKTELSRWGVHRLITVAHPWSKLGGNMLTPVLSRHLVSAVYGEVLTGIPGDTTHPRTAVLALNVRGAGRSQGSSLLGLSTQTDAEDYAAVESWGIGALGESLVEVRRFGYSMGTASALLAPTDELRPALTSILLLSCPTFLLGLVLWSASAIPAAVRKHLDTTPHLGGSGARGRSVWMVYGTGDEFTAGERYLRLADDVNPGRRGDNQLVTREVEGATHFYLRPQDGQRLEEIVKEWLQTGPEVTIVAQAHPHPHRDVFVELAAPRYTV